MGASPSKLRVENVSDTSVVVEMDWGNGATSAVEVGPRAAEVITGTPAGRSGTSGVVKFPAGTVGFQLRGHDLRNHLVELRVLQDPQSGKGILLVNNVPRGEYQPCETAADAKARDAKVAAQARAVAAKTARPAAPPLVRLNPEIEEIATMGGVAVANLRPVQLRDADAVESRFQYDFTLEHEIINQR